MPIYAKRLNGKQRAALNQYERLTGVEPMGQEDLDSGAISFADLWRMNVKWIEDVAAGVQNINTDGACGWDA